MTGNNVLKDKICKVIDNSQAPEGIVTRIQEANGVSLRNSMVRSDPFPRDKCDREDACKDRCHQCHCNYTLSCRECDEKVREAANAENADVSCNDKPVRFLYVGESCRGCLTRFEQHMEMYKSAKNFMWEHARDIHNRTDTSHDVYQDFDMRLEGVDRDPLRRVVREAVRIRRIQDHESKTSFAYETDGEKKRVGVKTVLMNSKEEFHLPKLVSVSLSQQ